MKTLQDEWKQWAEMIYPDGMTKDQHRQIHQAFFCGAFSALHLALGIAAENLIEGGPSGGSASDLRDLYEEAKAVCGDMARRERERN